LIEAGEMFGVGMLAASGKGGLQSSNTYVALEPSEILTIDRFVCMISHHHFESLATVLTYHPKSQALNLNCSMLGLMLRIHSVGPVNGHPTY